VIGWLHEIEGYRREDAESFYRSWYAPNNAVLLVVGDTTSKELRTLAQAAYGSIPARPLPQRWRPAEPPQHAERRVSLTDPRVRQPSLVRSYLAPSFASASGSEAYALSVLAEILGGGGTSRLYRRLVIEEALAVAAGCHYHAGLLDQTSFRIYVSPRPGVDLDAVEAGVDRELERLLHDGIEPDEVARTQRRMLAEAAYARDSLNGAAHVLGASLTAGQTVADVEAWPTRIRAVTPEQIDDAARAIIKRQSSVTGRLLAAG
jgi:zinc protease